MLFWHFIKSSDGYEKNAVFPRCGVRRGSSFLPPNDKTNDKIKKNFKKWEAPAE